MSYLKDQNAFEIFIVFAARNCYIGEMKSMTGYGRAEAALSGWKVLAEISSINKKGLDIVLHLPGELGPMESEIREILQSHISRGRVSVNIHISRATKNGHSELPINISVLEQHHRQLARLAKKLEHPSELPFSYLLTLPGVMNHTRSPELDRKEREAILTNIKKALKSLNQAREREGKFLCKHLIQQFHQLEKIVEAIARTNPSIVARYRDNLRKRIEEAGIPLACNDERLLKEVALFAERADISEEITRLRAHFKEARRLLSGSEAAGRNLDFLLQEINREVNTTGSKANGLEISQQVIILKTELEKIREQVQNLE